MRDLPYEPGSRHNAVGPEAPDGGPGPTAGGCLVGRSARGRAMNMDP